MFIPRIEGVIAAAGSGGGNGNGGGGGSAAPPDTGLASRKKAVLAAAAAEQPSSTFYIQGAWTVARYLHSGQSAGDAALDIILNAKHPAQGGSYKKSDTFDPAFWAMIKLYGNPTGTRDARLRDVLGAYDTQQNITTSNVLQSSGRTPNQFWMNMAGAVFCWEQWQGQSFGSTGAHANHSGVQSRYNFARDTFWPQYADHVWRHGYQEMGIGYLALYLMIAWMLKDKATNSSLRAIGDFLFNQLVLYFSHLYGFDQMALPGIRQHQHFSGTPRHPEALEMAMWLLFGGTQYEVARARYILAETQYLVPLAASGGLVTSAYDVARTIRHTASTHPGFAVKSAERRVLQEESVGRGAASPSYPYIWCTPKYQVGHFVWGGGTLCYNDRVTGAATPNHLRDYRQWQITIKNPDANCACNTLVVSGDVPNVGNFLLKDHQIATSPFEFTAGLEGTIVSAFNIEDASAAQFIHMAIPPVFTSTATSGDWWFGAAANCYVAVFFDRGFTQQAARTWTHLSPTQRFHPMPWLRSPGSGSAATHVIAIETADPADYASFSAFQSAVLNTVRNGAAGGIANTNVNTPRITYADLKGNTFDVTYKGSIIVNGAKVTTQHHNGTVSSPHHKRLDTPWVQLDYGGNDMIVTDPADGVRRRHRWSDKTVTVL